METTKLSSKGQVVIPKPVRAAHDWKVGQELVVIEMGDGILLRPTTPFDSTDIDEVAASLSYSGDAVTLDEMDEAIRRGVSKRDHGRD